MMAAADIASVSVAVQGKVYKHRRCSNRRMTAEGYQSEGRTYEVRLLKDLRASVRSIDGKVEEILDELKEHLPDSNSSRNYWSPADFYDDASEMD
jgi:hypothetical protein